MTTFKLLFDEFGLSQSVMTALENVLRSYSVEIKQVIIYGSRARGDYKPGSDIDLAIDAPKMSAKTFVKLWNELDDLPIIYSLDVIHLQEIANPNLKAEIAHQGKVFVRGEG